MYKIFRNNRGFLKVEPKDILIADCDFTPYENNSNGYEDYLVGLIKNACSSLSVCSVIYRTYKGLRVIVCNKKIDVNTESVAFLRSINTDSSYINFCTRHNAFSARLSPKPYRIGLANSELFKIPKFSPKKEKWIDDYEERCVNYATCKFKQSTQENPIVMPDIGNFLEVHDLKTKAFKDLPLA